MTEPTYSSHSLDRAQICHLPLSQQDRYILDSELEKKEVDLLTWKSEVAPVAMVHSGTLSKY